MPTMRRVVPTICCLLIALFSRAQHEAATFVSPLGVPLLLSANFGELRANHFHSGLDFKTQGRTGLNVYAADDGYVSRIAVSPWGYGKALYIDHPSGYTTVYAHLDDFASFIADTVLAIQYRRESFALDTTFAPGVMPVKRGMKVAVSGNSGSSGGPHLHFEIRHTSSESPIDPLPWYKSQIKDNIAPEPRLVALYRHDAVHNGVRVPKATREVVSVGSNSYKCKTNFEAWGRVSLGIKAYDRMSGTTNIYGVRNVRCYVDDVIVYQSCCDSITFSESRYINAFIDFHELRSNKGSAIMRTYMQPGNEMGIVYDDMPGNGTFIIDEEREYKCRYELTDLYGNKSVVRFAITGKKSAGTPKEPDGVHFSYGHDNEYATDEINIHIPVGALYDDVYFEHSAKPSDAYYSSVHNVHYRTVPLHKHCDISIKLMCDTLPDNKYYGVNIHSDKKSTIIGRYDAGWYTMRVRDLGAYAVTTDTIAPTITPHNSDKWATSGVVRFKIADKESGISTYRGEIDGKFCLFEYDAKRNMLSCELATAPISRNKTHKITISVADHCGNTTTKQQTIKW